jgi:hypothetical protein
MCRVLDFLSGLIAIVQPDMRTMGTFIFSHFYITVAVLVGDRFTVDVSRQVRGAISLFLTTMQMMSDKDCDELDCIAVHRLHNLPSFPALPPVEAGQLGTICLRSCHLSRTPR